MTDLNYGKLTDFSEMEFVVPGPGALDGIRKCFSDLGVLTEADAIKAVTEIQEQEFERLGIRFRSLGGRQPPADRLPESLLRGVQSMPE